MDRKREEDRKRQQEEEERKRKEEEQRRREQKKREDEVCVEQCENRSCMTYKLGYMWEYTTFPRSPHIK